MHRFLPQLQPVPRHRHPRDDGQERQDEEEFDAGERTVFHDGSVEGNACDSKPRGGIGD